MSRFTSALIFAVALIFASSLVAAQDASSLERYFSGKEVVVKIDMPGTQKGIDLRFNKPTPMNWKEYSSRLKDFGPAIRKGNTARVTSIVVKKDTIEFQLDGGGYGTFGDDTTTTVQPKTVEKSDYEKSLEKQISETTDEDQKRALQHDLDRERARREREQAANQRAAQVASQMKAEQVSDNRMHGGSRFNLRWDKYIPTDQLTPQAVMKLLADYIDFGQLQEPAAQVPTPPPASEQPASTDDSGSPTAHLKRGMKMSEVTDLLGSGKQLSASTSSEGLKTEVYEYVVDDRRAEVTYVDGIVVRFSISSK